VAVLIRAVLTPGLRFYAHFEGLGPDRQFDFKWNGFTDGPLCFTIGCGPTGEPSPVYFTSLAIYDRDFKIDELPTFWAAGPRNVFYGLRVDRESEWRNLARLARELITCALRSTAAECTNVLRRAVVD
jgi:hypothetical protein